MRFTCLNQLLRPFDLFIKQFVFSLECIFSYRLVASSKECWRNRSTCSTIVPRRHRTEHVHYHWELKKNESCTLSSIPHPQMNCNVSLTKFACSSIWFINSSRNVWYDVSLSVLICIWALTCAKGACQFCSFLTSVL